MVILLAPGAGGSEGPSAPFLAALGCATPVAASVSECATSKSTYAPSLRPIQLRCMVRTFSGQPSSCSSPALSSSAYLVVRKNHCSSSRCSTGVVSWRQQHPPTTCSFASTVAHSGHQFTSAFLRYASPPSYILRKNHWFQR